MKKIIFTLLLAASFVGTAQEKEEEKGTFTLSGTVDVYGTANFGDG